MDELRDCILFATADWDAPYWTNKQHTARQMAKSGMRVLYIESVGIRAPKLGDRLDLTRLWKRLVKGLRGIRAAEKNIWVLSPLVIPFKHHWKIVRLFNQGFLRCQIALFIRAYHFTVPTLVWTYHPFMLESLPRKMAHLLAYHCVDDLSAIPGIDAVAFDREEKRLLHKAQITFTTSEALRDKCAQHNPNVRNFSNVAEVDHFITAHHPNPLPPELQSIPEPRIGYVGVLSDFKVDFQLVLDIARAKTNWHWVFIGEEREGQASPLIATLKTLPNVHFLGFRPYALLPDYLRGFNVAVLPTLLNDYTRAMFPMKYYEYLAAGVPVASTPLDFTRTHITGLEIGADASTFTAAIEKQLRRGKLSLQESMDAVGNNTWSARLQKMLDLLHPLLPLAHKG